MKYTRLHETIYSYSYNCKIFICGILYTYTSIKTVLEVLTLEKPPISSTWLYSLYMSTGSPPTTGTFFIGVLPESKIQFRFKQNFQKTGFYNSDHSSYPFCSWNLYSWVRNSLCFVDVLVCSLQAINMWCHVVNAKKLARRQWLWVNKQAIKFTRSTQLQSKNTFLRL